MYDRNLCSIVVKASIMDSYNEFLGNRLAQTSLSSAECGTSWYKDPITGKIVAPAPWGASTSLFFFFLLAPLIWPLQIGVENGKTDPNILPAFVLPARSGVVDLYAQDPLGGLALPTLGRRRLLFAGGAETGPSRGQIAADVDAVGPLDGLARAQDPAATREAHDRGQTGTGSWTGQSRWGRSFDSVARWTGRVSGLRRGGGVSFCWLFENSGHIYSSTSRATIILFLP